MATAKSSQKKLPPKKVEHSFAEKIIFTTDKTEAKFKEVKTHDDRGERLKDALGIYEYTKASTKKGLTLPVTQSQYNDMLRREILKPIVKK
jgi:hypothetical protein